MNRYFVSPLLVLALSGCSGSTTPQTSDVVLVPTKNLYTSGETVSAQLFNRSQEQIGYGACSLRIERFEAAGWVLIGPEQVPCIAILYVLEGGNARILQLQLDPTLGAGIYRLRHEILPHTSLPVRYIRSPEFRLQNAA